MPWRRTGHPVTDELVQQALRYGQTRWSEVLLAACMAGVGFTLLLPGETFSLPGYTYIRSYMPTEPITGTLSVIAGFARLFALWINGAWQKSPLVRAAGCIGGALFWAGFLWGFMRAPAPLGIIAGLLVPMVVMEVMALSRASRDAFAYDAFGERARRRNGRNSVP